MSETINYRVDYLDAIDGMATTLLVATMMLNTFSNLKDKSYWITSLNEQMDNVSLKLAENETDATDLDLYNSYKLTIERNMKKILESGIPDIFKSYYSFLEENYNNFIERG